MIEPLWPIATGVEGWVQEELVRLAKQGDAEAFDALARMAGDRCLAIAVRILRDHDLAEDAVQAALIRAWIELRSLRDPSRFEPWLHRILEADGASVSGRAVTTFAGDTHTVGLECASRDGDFWAVAGTIEETTVQGERAGAWSAVIVNDASPQRIGIWLSDPKFDGTDCDEWLASIDLADLGPENFQPVESGALVSPSDPAP